MEAYRHYEGQQSGLGVRFRAELQVAFALVLQFNEAGPVVHHQLRRMMLRRFPYAVYYQLTEQDVVVWACLHLRGHPRRWKGS